MEDNLYNPLLAVNSLPEMILRLFMALVFGGLVGWEREVRNKPAGLRTHMLVSLGSALMALIPIQLGAAQQSADAISRVIQGIVTGIGFLGAGEIIRQPKPDDSGLRVRGLTSAAAIWVSAGLGITAGCGLWKMGVTAVVMAWLILRFFKLLER